MFTDCPACQRQFRLSARHLSAAAGQVCCGFCGARFNALERLRDAPMESSAAVALAREPESDLEEPDFDIAIPAVAPAMPAVERPRPIWSPAPEPMNADAVGGPRSGWAWAVVALLLLVFGAGQVAWFQRDEILDRYPALAPHAERLCLLLDCSVLRYRDLGALTVLNRDVRAHPRYQDALLVNATISNGAGFAQPVKPVVNESLSGNLNERLGTIIGQRPHAHPKARGKDHGMAADSFGHSGKFRSYQRFRTARSGCSRLRLR